MSSRSSPSTIAKPKRNLILEKYGIDDDAVENFRRFIEILREWDRKSRLPMPRADRIVQESDAKGSLLHSSEH